MNVVIDRESPDVWEKQAELRWGKYLTDRELEAVQYGIDIARAKGGANTALDIGGGAGRWSKILIDNGFATTTSEVCDKKSALCQRNNPTANCVVVSPDSTTFPFEDNEFDFAIAIEVEISEAQWFIPEVARVLKDSGSAVITLNNRDSYRGKLANVKSWMKNDEIFYPRSYRDLKKQLAQYDMSIKKEIGFGWFPFRRFSDSKLIPFCTGIEESLQLRRLVRWSPWVAVVCEKNVPVHRRDLAHSCQGTPSIAESCSAPSRHGNSAAASLQKK